MNEENDSSRSRFRLSSPGTAVLLGLGVLALLALVAAASRAHDTPGGQAGGHRPPTGVGDYLFSIFAVVFVGGALGLVYLWLTERDVRAQRRDGNRGMLRSLAFLLALALFAALIMRFRGDLWRHGAPPARANLGGSNATPIGALGDQGETAPDFKWLPVMIATLGAVAVLSVIGARSLRRERRGLDETYLLEQEFEGLVEDTLADLYAETDPRRAIIAAYARVERLFGSFGLPRDPSEAPVEYLERVLPELRASGSALRRLTRLFERAKFSTHDVDLSMRDDAIAALILVRDELRASRIDEVA
jgi:multisubunit Na+/H+ antiporter MnhB subunit